MKCTSCAAELHAKESEKVLNMRISFVGGEPLRCPRCGAEIPQMPDLEKLFRKWGRRKVSGSK